jgi:hypothetical protein
MLRMSHAVALVLFGAGACDASAQDLGYQTRELVAALDKTKYKKKEKANVSIELYLDVKNQAVVRDPVEYGGDYESEECGCRLSLQVERDGTVTGSGFDAIDGETDRGRNFVLKDASINGALLAGMKFYENGEQRKFEAVFVNRTVAWGRNRDEIASRETRFGVGYIEMGGGMEARVFLERR